PRVSIARAKRLRNSLSSSTISSERSPAPVAAAASVIETPSTWPRLARTRVPWDAAAPPGRAVSRIDLGISSQVSRGGLLLRPAQRPLEIVPAPAHPDHGAGLRRRPVGQRQGGAGALQQRFGDEETQSEADRVRVGAGRAHATGGHVGLADPI